MNFKKIEQDYRDLLKDTEKKRKELVKKKNIIKEDLYKEYRKKLKNDTKDVSEELESMYRSIQKVKKILKDLSKQEKIVKEIKQDARDKTKQNDPELKKHIQEIERKEQEQEKEQDMFKELSEHSGSDF